MARWVTYWNDITFTSEGKDKSSYKMASATANKQLKSLHTKKNNLQELVS